MKPTRLAATLVAGWLLLALTTPAAEPAAPENTGLAVGQMAPAFTLKDQNGRDVSLDSLLKKGPVALVFHRSADW
jgi:cytochrome oxidase Cu insertion factor (SCO1/SenC/PrrC family)